MNRICPGCMSAQIESEDKGRLINGLSSSYAVTCLNCGWKGVDTDLLGIPDRLVDKHLASGVGADTAQSIAETMATTLLTKIAGGAAHNMGLAIIEAGFVGLQDRTHLGRLIRAACLAAVRGVLLEVEAIHKEVSSGN
jgi:hypothetical protein